MDVLQRTPAERLESAMREGKKKRSQSKKAAADLRRCMGVLSRTGENDIYTKRKWAKRAQSAISRGALRHMAYQR